MGMLTPEPQRSANLAEVFPPGVPFRLTAAADKGIAPSQTGERRLFTVTVSPVENAEQLMEFGVWGSLAEQLTQLEAGELPAIVTLREVNSVWVFAPHGPEPVTVETPDGPKEVPQTVAVEAHMVPDAPTDSALGAVAERPAPPAPPVPEGGHAQPVAPPIAKPAGTELDEAQTFQPNQG